MRPVVSFGVQSPVIGKPMRRPVLVATVARGFTPITVPWMSYEQLLARALPSAVLDAMRDHGLQVCTDIAYVDGPTRAAAVRDVIAAWRATWTPQMERVVTGAAWPREPIDGPLWYVEVMEGAAGRVDVTKRVLWAVLERMPARVVDWCAVVRRQSERE